MIPSILECIKIMDRYGMLDNIKAHSIMVTKVAYIISYELIDQGNTISMQKVLAGALLHDIGKTEALRSGKDHTKIGVEICIDNGFHEVAEIVAEHVILKKFSPKYPYTEKEIIYYSDKRVNHDKVVSLEERLHYILERYSKGDQKMSKVIRKNFELCKKVEEKLFKNITFSPNELVHLVNKISFDTQKGLIGWYKNIGYFH